MGDSDRVLWTVDAHPGLVGCGHRGLLDEALVAFFASRQCPGAAIREAMNWALAHAHTRQPVISGFHSPLEQSVLKVLLQARTPVVAVLARPVAHARLPAAWTEPLAQGRMAVVGAAALAGRLTSAKATERNQWVTQLASQIVVSHASPEGGLVKLCDQWLAQGRAITRLG